MNRIGAIRRYFSLSASPTRWRTTLGKCPKCGPTVFAVLGPSAFLTRCMRCRANAVTLSLIPVIRRHFDDRFSGRATYELSTFGASLEWMRNVFSEVVTSEFFPSKERGILIDGVLNQNIEALTFSDEVFDLITANGVFEHVNDDEAGYRETCRVLKPGGAMIMSVPLYDISATHRISRYRADGSLEWFATPEYHDSRLGGPMSAPVVWYHSKRDIAQRVEAAGFSRVELVDVLLTPMQRDPTAVVYAVK